jgi:hypothetical protein
MCIVIAFQLYVINLPYMYIKKVQGYLYRSSQSIFKLKAAEIKYNFGSSVAVFNSQQHIEFL